MGRYIDGDIEHKFWFGVQPSNAASQFGGEIGEDYIPYRYNDMDDFNVERLKYLIRKFNEESKTKISLETEPDLLYTVEEKRCELRADIQLGLRIYQHIKIFGPCTFLAEW